MSTTHTISKIASKSGTYDLPNKPHYYTKNSENVSPPVPTGIHNRVAGNQKRVYQRNVSSQCFFEGALFIQQGTSGRRAGASIVSRDPINATEVPVCVNNSTLCWLVRTKDMHNGRSLFMDANSHVPCVNEQQT